MGSFVGSKHFVKVRNIKQIFWKFWFEIWNKLLGLEGVDINITEPRMSQNFLYVSVSSKSITGFLSQTFANEILAVFRHCDTMLLSIWEKHWFSFNEIIHLLVIGTTSVKWWETNNHFICQYTESPPINWESMTLFF